MELTCETKPIRDDSASDRAAGMRAAAVVQTNPIGRSELCKTNPIREESYGGSRAKQTQSRPGSLWHRHPADDPAKRRLRQTKPISSSRSAPTRRCVVRTLRARPKAGCTNKANFRRGHGSGKWLVEKELWCIVPSTGFGKTKPNLGRMGHLGNTASDRDQWCDIALMLRFGKRSQFRQSRAGRGREDVGCGMRDWGQMCKTKPISDGTKPGGRPREALYRQSQFP